jgi:hypothetical protein
MNAAGEGKGRIGSGGVRRLSPAFFPLSLVLILLCAGVAPFPVPLRALGAILLLALWGYGLWRAREGSLPYSSPVGLLPGHALFFLGLGLVGARAAVWAWCLSPPLSLGLDLARRTGRRSLIASLYVILWADLFALLHQLVALGRAFTDLALWVWTGGLGIAALTFIILGTVRILKMKG